MLYPHVNRGVFMLTDGDLVTISDSSDVVSAIQCSPTLKLRIFLNTPNEDSVEYKHSKAVADIGAIKKEFSENKDKVSTSGKWKCYQDNHFVVLFVLHFRNLETFRVQILPHTPQNLVPHFTFLLGA